MTSSFTAVFYYQILNIEPELRSRLQSIMLLTIVDTAILSKYGTNTILEPFVESVKLLESVNMKYYN